MTSTEPAWLAAFALPLPAMACIIFCIAVLAWLAVSQYRLNMRIGDARKTGRKP